MISFIKTQWWRLLCALVCFVIAIIYMFTEKDLMVVAWMLSFVYWVITSVVMYNYDRISLLEKKTEKYDALCEKVDALYEANKIDREYILHLRGRIEKLEGKSKK